MAWAETLGWGAAALAGLGGSALCSGVETGAYCASRVRLSVRANDAVRGRGARRLLSELEHPERVLGTVLLSNNACNYVGTLGLGGVLAQLGLSGAGEMALQLLVVTPLLLVFGEALPKELFRARADRWTPGASVALTAARLVLTVTGVLPVVLWMARGLSRLLGGEPAGAAVRGRLRVIELLRESASSGSLSREQGTLIDRALEFGRATVGEQMTPWAQTAWVPAGAGREAVLGVAGRRGVRAVPVVDRSGRVAAVVHRLDLLAEAGRTPAGVGRAPVRLAAEMSAREGLVRMQGAGSSLAIVEDAGGRPVGVVTAQDLLEPLTGELVTW